MGPWNVNQLFATFVRGVDLTAEMVGVLCIAYGVAEAAVMSVSVIIRRHLTIRHQRKEIFGRFASWIILALEFALAADIVRTAIAPTWNDIGMLAAIAAIRTALNYFLERDLDALDGGGRGRIRRRPAAPAASADAPPEFHGSATTGPPNQL